MLYGTFQNPGKNWARSIQTPHRDMKGSPSILNLLLEKCNVAGLQEEEEIPTEELEVKRSY